MLAGPLVHVDSSLPTPRPRSFADRFPCRVLLRLLLRRALRFGEDLAIRLHLHLEGATMVGALFAHQKILRSAQSGSLQ